MAKTAPDFPTKKHMEALEDLIRKGGSVWSQLKTGHVGLNKHLSRIIVMDSARCPKCKDFDETVEHFLLHCAAYRQQRKDLKKKVKGHLRNLRRLLGNHKNTKLVVKYVFATGRLTWARDGQQDRQVAEQEGEMHGGRGNGEGRGGGRREGRRGVG